MGQANETVLFVSVAFLFGLKEKSRWLCFLQPQKGVDGSFIAEKVTPANIPFIKLEDTV